MRLLLLYLSLVLFMLPGSITRSAKQQPVADSAARAQARYTYLSPRPGATFVSPGTTIALRFGVELDPRSLAPALFDVVGSHSGRHSGHTVLADDRMTGIFKPDRSFAAGETVAVTVHSGLRSTAGESLAPQRFSFTIAPRLPAGWSPPQIGGVATANANGSGVAEAAAPFRTAPSDFPVITTTVSTEQAADGNLFVATFGWATPDLASYLLIFDREGEPVYYKRLPGVTLVADFKAQPNGLLTYYDNLTGVFHALDASYTEVATYRAGNGYSTDPHELLLLPNGHALLMIYSPRPFDMSQLVDGGLPNAFVVDLVIQELDSAGNVVFEWDSQNHFAITDTTEQLVNAAVVDYAHGNAIEVDTDGHLLISNRHMDEITKINRQTGAIIWRLGGKHNQFTFTNDQPFVHQHDIRRLPNGHIMLFDNRTDQAPPYSRAVEYALDEDAKTITRVKEFRNTPDTYSLAMGSAQRLPNGNTLIGWGSAQTALLTEFTPDGDRAFELQAARPLVSYRAFRLPWQGQPLSAPTLVVDSDADTTTLAYSWNGATDVASYKVYGGMSANPTTLLATQPKTGFETTTTLPDDAPLACFFRVVPFDAQGNELLSSAVVQDYGPRCRDRIAYFPLLSVTP